MPLTQPYLRPSAGPDSPRFRRWLVTVDVLPDIGEVAGFLTVTAHGHTLNVAPRAGLLGAVELIRRAGRALHHLAAEHSWSPAGFRYSFCLLDLATQTAVTVEQLQAWAELHSVTPPVGVEPGVFYREVAQAAVLARSLSGYFAPNETLLDGTEPFTLLREQGLLALRPGTASPTNVQPYDSLRHAVGDKLYNAAIRQANDSGRLAWVAGLATLPGEINTAIDRAAVAKVAELTSEALGRSLAPASAVVATIGPTVARLVASVRTSLLVELYRQILEGGYDYTTAGALDGLVEAALLSVWEGLPAPLAALDPRVDPVPVPLG